MVLSGQISFSREQLNNLSQFLLSFVFIVATLGFTIFSLNKNHEQPLKKQILLSYVGNLLLISSISIFTYILSFCDFLNIKFFGKFDVFSIYFCAILLLICHCIIHLLSTVIAYFDIKE